MYIYVLNLLDPSNFVVFILFFVCVEIVCTWLINNNMPSWFTKFWEQYDFFSFLFKDWSWEVGCFKELKTNITKELNARHKRFLIFLWFFFSFYLKLSKNSLKPKLATLLLLKLWIIPLFWLIKNLYPYGLFGLRGKEGE